MSKIDKPLLRGHFHQAMFFTAIGALIPLLFRTQNFQQFISIFIYMLCVLSMFGISSLYHRVNWTLEKRLLWKKLDHSGIYLMIAGSFTPISILGLGGESGKTILTLIWIVAAIGILQSLFFVNLPKYISAILYLIAGYLILPYMAELQQAIGWTNTNLIIAGGLSYSVGAVCYAIKKPKLNPKYFSYHEVFHIFVNIGATCHFFAISALIK